MISKNLLITLITLFCITIDLIESNKQLDTKKSEYIVTSPMKKYRADIETVKQNIDEYNKLMKIDTKKLSDQQKEMIQRIVERVARLKESIETNATTKNPITINNNQTLNITTADVKKNDILLETTTILPINTLQDTITMDTSTINYDEQTDGTTFQLSESYEGRSNTIQQPNSRSTTISGTSIKMKNHRTSTKKPSTTKSTTKRIILNTGSTFHPIKSSTKPFISTMGTTIINNNDQTVMTPTTLITTLQPQQQQKLNEQTTTSNEEESKTMEYTGALSSNEQDDNQTNENNANDDSYLAINQPQQPNSNVIIQQRTPVGTGSGYLSADILNQRPSASTGTNYLSSALYDTNVTTSTIIDSLSNHAREDYYNTNINKGTNVDTNKDKKPTGGTAKPTKYHYYPHNQHIYLLPECAIQQVCNAVYVRLNYTQPLCACPSRYRDPCSASLNEDDQHTTKLIGDAKKKAITLAKTCEATTEMRECRSPKDWSLLALQNTRTGKSHYLVICRCPDHFKLEGPMAHDQPTYASVPGIRVFGMMCVKPGFAIRKPSVQPPKRYQLQKPYYIPQTSNKYNLNKDNVRPSISSLSSNGYQQQQSQTSQLHDSYQLQHQANYQYLNRPENTPILSSSSNTDYPDPTTFSNNNGIYGRNNEKKNNDEQNTDLNEDISKTKIDNIRVKRYATIKENNKIDKYNYDNEVRTPDFPWDKVVEFQKSLVWDN